MNRQLVIICVLITTGCIQSPDKEEIILTPNNLFVIEPHNTADEYFVGVPIDLRINSEYQEYSEIIWTYLGQENWLSNPTVGFQTSGEYTIGVEAVSVIDNTRLQKDTTIRLVSSPKLLGEYTDYENVKAIWAISEDKYGLMYVRNQVDFYYQILDKDFEVISSKFYTSSSHLDFGLSAISGENSSLALIIGNSLVILNPNNEILSREIFQKRLLDIHFVENELMVLVDSASHLIYGLAEKETFNLRTKQVFPINVEGYYFHSAFFGGSGTEFTVLMRPIDFTGIDLLLFWDGDSFRTIYFNGESIDRVWPTSEGWIITPPVTDENPTFIYLNSSGQKKWSHSFRLNNLQYLNYILGPAYQVIEEGNFIYVICDNYRIIKLNLEGELVWDKSFDLKNSIFQSAALRNGYLVLAGARQFDSFNHSYTTDYSLRDIAIMKIGFNGERN